MIPQFEVSLRGLFNVSSAKAAILDERPDAPGDVFPAPGPFHPAPSNHILQTDQDLHVHVEWTVSGGIAPLIDGKWKVEVYLEEMGSRNANPPSSQRVVANLPFLNPTKTFQETVNIQANTIRAGLYKIALAITFTGPNGQPLPVAGFAELGMVQYYDSI